MVVVVVVVVVVAAVVAASALLLYDRWSWRISACYSELLNRLFYDASLVSEFTWN
jgi:hypothetical protein